MTGGPRLAPFAALATMLAASALVPLYATLPWFWPGVATVIVVVTAAEGARRARLPRPLVLLAGVAGLTVALTLGWARATAPLGLLPGPAAVHALRELLRDGLADAQRLAAPVPPTPGLRLLAVGGLGLVSLLVDAVGVTWRRPALAGLPLLALFAVPAVVLPDGLGILPFLLGAAGYLALLLADQRERLGQWGRPLGRGRNGSERTEQAVTAPLAAVGRRVGVLAVGLAVVVPSLVPGLRPGGLGGDGPGGFGGHGGSIVVVNPIVTLKRDLTLPEPVEVMRVRTADPDPDYLRMVTLDVFDGISWRQSTMTAPATQRVARGMPLPLGLDTAVPNARVTTRVRVSRLDVPWLPLPYPATAVGVKGDWRYDGASRVVFSTRPSTRGLSYTAVSLRVRPPREVLDAAPPPAGVDRHLQVPPDLPQVVPELAADVTAGATTPYRQAVALQNWFRTQFAYDVSVAPGNGSDALLAFLEDRRGYCEQFAATMAVMARTLGIPARVAIGFTPGVRTSGGTWSVTTRDAHAWPELFFRRVGWTRFEPTPLGDGRASVPAYSVPPFSTGAVSGADATPGGDQRAPAASASPRPNRLADNLRGEDRTPTGGAVRRSAVPVFPVAALVLLLVVLVTPAVLDHVARRRRWSRALTPLAAAHAGWAEVRRAATDFGFPPAVADSPRAAAGRLAETAGLGAEDASALARLARAEELARYARSLPPDAADAAAGRAAAARVRAALAGRVPRWRRWAARACPPSVIDEARVVADAGADALNAADRWAAAARCRVSGLVHSGRVAVRRGRLRGGSEAR